MRIGRVEYVDTFLPRWEDLDDIEIQVMVRMSGLGDASRGDIVQQFTAEIQYNRQIENVSSATPPTTAATLDRIIQVLRFTELEVMRPESFIGTDGASVFTRILNTSISDSGAISDTVAFDEELIAQDMFLASTNHVFQCKGSRNGIRTS